MPTRISCMYPGSSGASRNLNMMSEGNGNNKWQGLPGLTNLRSSLVVPVTTRAYGTNRDKVFCINQLGGIGRFSNMFASTADGAKQDCQGSNTSNTSFNYEVLSVPLLNPPQQTLDIISLLSQPVAGKKNSFWLGNLSNYQPEDIAKKAYEVYNTIPLGNSKLDNDSNDLLQSNVGYSQYSAMFIVLGIDTNDTVSSTNGFSNLFINQGYDNRKLILLGYVVPSIRNNAALWAIPNEVDSNGFLKQENKPATPPTSPFDVPLYSISLDMLPEYRANNFLQVFITGPLSSTLVDYTPFVVDNAPNVTPQNTFSDLKDLISSQPWKLAVPILTSINTINTLHSTTTSGNNNLVEYTKKAMTTVDTYLSSAPSSQTFWVPLFLVPAAPPPATYLDIAGGVMGSLYAAGAEPSGWDRNSEQIAVFMINNGSFVRSSSSHTSGDPIIQFFNISTDNNPVLLTGAIDGI